MGEIRTFLKDVLIVSLSTHGGREAHYGVFAKQMVDKHDYISEDEFNEYMALFPVILLVGSLIVWGLTTTFITRHRPVGNV